MPNQPPPPDAIASFVQSLHQGMAQRNAEYEEVRRLKREIEKRKLEQELVALSSQTQPTKPLRQPLGFYEKQITAWFNRLPPAARAAPRTMQDFINLLEGRTPGMRAHAPDVSRILSRLGWVRQRLWKTDGEGRRLWIPPSIHGSV